MATLGLLSYTITESTLYSRSSVLNATVSMPVAAYLVSTAFGLIVAMMVVQVACVMKDALEGTYSLH